MNNQQTANINDLFGTKERKMVEKRISNRVHRGRDTQFVDCIIRNRPIQLKPEEQIRQLWLAKLINQFGYAKDNIKVEYSISLGATRKSADIVVLDKDHDESPYIVVEVKKENRKEGKSQLKSYCNATGAPIAVWSNGQDIISWNRKDPNYFFEIPDIPRSDETLEDLINQPWTIQTLIEKEKNREKGNKTLRELIIDLEDEVLSNSGVDVFEEVFKLIFIKMFDEVISIENNQNLSFRNTNANSEFRRRIDRLFVGAKNKWPGVFNNDDELRLETDHLRICVSSLESWKLFNSNLDIVDDAFEYLVQKSSRGEKGQYFTPRWVIDMCVKLLDPKENESIIDPACGSAGFLIHATFHNWRRILLRIGRPISELFSAEEKPLACRNYVVDNVFGIDFDERVVRVAKCINLIAGDGQTNILKLNSLDYKNWGQNEESWRDVYGDGWGRLRGKLTARNNSDYRNFNFDVCLANPPFSGAVQQSRILSMYEIARKPDGKIVNKLDRDILYVERCIDMVRPGGRIAIVLPEGRLNNPSNEGMRNYIADRCRILAVVTLHKNSFKPHTGIRTGVLFLQKWNHDSRKGPLCPRSEDYDIFYAIQTKESVNNKGLKVYIQNEEGFIRDSHGHLVVHHDLFNHEDITEDGIVESFTTWARDKKLSFIDAGSDENNPNSSSTKTYTAKLSDGQTHKRIDPKFFDLEHQKRYESIRSNAERTRKIKDFTVKNDRGVQPKYVCDGDISVIKSGNILDGYLDYGGFGFTTSDKYSKKKFRESQVFYDDILIYTTGANIGRTAIYKGDGQAIASNHVNILRIREENPTYVAFVLNSEIGRFQINQMNSGSAQPEIYPKDIGEIEIPFLSAEKEEELVSSLIEAEEQRKSSLEILSNQSSQLKESLLK